MSRELLFADQSDQEELQEILWDYQMDLYESIGDHLIIRENNEVLAGAKIILDKAERFFIVVFGVKRLDQNKGLGGYLLSKVVENPWVCCQETRSKPRGSNYQISTIARGEAVGFYGKYGFRPCDFSQIPSMFSEQCQNCLDKKECNPVPMIYDGG